MNGLPPEALATVLDLVERPALLVSRTGEVLLANAAAARLRPVDVRAGNGAARLRGRRLEELLGVEDGDALRSALRRAGPGTEGSRGRRLRVSADGSPPRTVELVVRPLSADEEGPCCVLLHEGGAWDLPVAGTRSLAELAHDLRQPLQAAVGYAELLSSGTYGKLAPPQARAAERVRDAVQRLTSLVEATLLELGRGDGRGGGRGEPDVDGAGAG